MKNLTIYVLLSLATLFVISCTASNSANNPNTERKNAAKKGSDLGAPTENIPLANYLRKIPGLRISGRGTTAKVVIAGIGNSSLMANNSPLFILDGVRMGNNLPQISSLVETSNIKSVKVLKAASETAFYGSAGANGVIVITSKKGSE